MNNKKVIVIGGGVSGLSTSYQLAKKGYRVDLYEESDKLGGLISTVKSKNGIAESAANGIINSECVENFLTEINVPYTGTLKSARNRYIFVDGQAQRWPFTFFETFKIIFIVIKFKIIGFSKMSPFADETVSEWSQRIFGSELNRKLLEPALLGIYASKSKELNAQLILRKLFAKTKTKKPKLRGTIAPLNGMGDLIEKLVLKNKELGVNFILNKKYDWSLWDEGLTPHVICTSALQAKILFKDKFKDLYTHFQNIKMVSIISITMHFSKHQVPLNGFGCLFSPEENMNSLGVLFPHCIFPNRSNEYAETWIMGEGQKSDHFDISESDLIDKVYQDRSKILNSNQRAKEFFIFKWKDALPLYDNNLKMTLDSLHLPKGLYLNGNFLGTIGLAAMIERAKFISHQMDEDYREGK